MSLQAYNDCTPTPDGAAVFTGDTLTTKPLYAGIKFCNEDLNDKYTQMLNVLQKEATGVYGRRGKRRTEQFAEPTTPTYPICRVVSGLSLSVAATSRDNSRQCSPSNSMGENNLAEMLAAAHLSSNSAGQWSAPMAQTTGQTTMAMRRSSRQRWTGSSGGVSGPSAP